ncbi:twin-arginine translocation signal domain-containing protein [Inmirania thermothiophila]|uniref:Secreted protein n=1 Tax=Inmirania thermothiophila TaxID=1750597 RepID=A0A3N1Y3Z6_9GAMM|nr:twin-arginine translocation signal domain-containing protein [Inmirania thermothiophila]ROR32332.1 secreted protein [Inmirania thermothiophila]
MSSEERRDGRTRREFLKGMAAGAGAVAAVRVAQAALVPPGSGVQAARPARGAGYRETEHVRTYYETARI